MKKQDSETRKNLPPEPVTRKDALGSIRGEVKIVIRDARTKEVVEEKLLTNVVTNTLLMEQLYALAGEGLGDRWLNQMQVGTDGTPPDPTDDHITNPVSFDITSSTFPSGEPRKFILTAILGSTVGNGVSYQEVGLVFKGTTPRLAARRVFDAMTKSEGFEWEFIWTLSW
jgi:hypothetical protein